jgi:hypothetical protein
MAELFDVQSHANLCQPGPGHMIYSKQCRIRTLKNWERIDRFIYCMCSCHLMMLDQTALRILTKTKDYDDDIKLSDCGKEV